MAFRALKERLRPKIAGTPTATTAHRTDAAKANSLTTANTNPAPSVTTSALFGRFGWQNTFWAKDFLDKVAPDENISVDKVDAFVTQDTSMTHITSDAMWKVQQVAQLADGQQVDIDTAFGGVPALSAYAKLAAESAGVTNPTSVTAQQVKDFNNLVVKTNWDTDNTVVPNVPIWIPDQMLYTLKSGIAELQGIPDRLNPTFDGAFKAKWYSDGKEFLEQFRRVFQKDGAGWGHPVFVSHVITNADFKIRDQAVETGVVAPLKRGSFHTPAIDPQAPNKSNWEHQLSRKANKINRLLKEGKLKSDKLDQRGVLERGHLQPWENVTRDQQTQELFELFMAAQWGEFNEFGWQDVEAGARSVLFAVGEDTTGLDGKSGPEALLKALQTPGASATIYTGAISLDANGNVIAPPTTLGKQQVGIPTHLWMSVATHAPNFPDQVYAILAPNIANDPRLLEDTKDAKGNTIPGILSVLRSTVSKQGWRISNAGLQSIVGLVMHNDLSDADRTFWYSPENAQNMTVNWPNPNQADPLQHDGYNMFVPGEPPTGTA